MAPVRVAAHVHSDWSYDGRWSLRDLARSFAQRRYDAVLLADHDRTFDAERWREYVAACAEATGDGALLVPGLEYSDAENAVHVPVWGVDMPFLGRQLETGELLRRSEQAGGLAMLAHPDRRDAWKRFEPEWGARLLGIELWNRKHDGYAPSVEGAALLRDWPGLVPFVGLDFHTRRQFHPLAMELDLDGPLTVAGVCAALAARRCRPTAFRLPAVGLSRGPALRTMRGAESARRSVARQLRKAQADRKFHPEHGR